jgi:hypothetical protein
MARRAGWAYRRFITPGWIGGGTPAPVAPILAAPTAADFSDVFVWGQATTDTASGTLYAVVVPFADTTPTAAQIVAGTNAAGAAAPSANLAVTSTGVKQMLVRGLTAATFYKVCFAHQAAGINSGVVSANFTTDTLIGAYATTGATTGLSPVNSAALVANTADPHGGTGAIRWADSNDAGTGTCTVTVLSATYPSQQIKVHVTVKHQGGAQWVKLIPVSMTSLAFANFNASTGALGTETWVGTPGVFDVNGWKMLSGVCDLTGADVTGTWSIQMAPTDNSTGTVVRNGTNIKDLYNIRFTRV